MAPSRRRGASWKASGAATRSAAIQEAERRRLEEEDHHSAFSPTEQHNNNNIDMPSMGIQVVVGQMDDPFAEMIHTTTMAACSQETTDALLKTTSAKAAINATVARLTEAQNTLAEVRNNTYTEVCNQIKKLSLIPPFVAQGDEQSYCKVVPSGEHLHSCYTSCNNNNTNKNNLHSQIARKSGYKRKEDFEYCEDHDDDDDSVDEGCLHCHQKVKTPMIRVIEDDEEGSNHNDLETNGYSKGSSNIQVRCDDCRGYICNGCHWCHEFQANHEIRVCDRCDAFYCRTCDEMDQCDDCGEVVCGSCSTLLSCKFCGGGLCEECATSCGRCGIVLCSRDAKFAVDCDTCRLSYCLVCLASGSKEPCVRCGHRPSKRMEQLVHLRLKSIYKAFKSSNSSNGGGSGGHNTQHHKPQTVTCGGDNSTNGPHPSNTKASNSGRSRRTKPTTLQDMVGDHEEDETMDPTMTMMMGGGAPPGVLPHKFCHDLEQNYIAEQKKADAAAEALLAELEEEETAIAQKKSKKKKKKERKNASKQQQQQQQQKQQDKQQLQNEDTGKKEENENKDLVSKKATPEIVIASETKNDRIDEDHSSDNNDEGEDKAEHTDESKVDPVEKELVECVNSCDLDGIEKILLRLKGVPGRAALRKNAKKALKRLKLELHPPTPPTEKPPEVPKSKTERKSTMSSTRSPPRNSKPSATMDSKVTKKTALKSAHDRSAFNGSKTSNSKSSSHKNPTPNRCEAVVEIVSRLVGWMIGKNGQRIRDLMEESGAKIWIDQEKFKGQETRNVYISGDKKSVDHAVILVNDVITNAPPPQGSTTTPPPTTTAVDTEEKATIAHKPPQETAPNSPHEVKSAWAKISNSQTNNISVRGTIPKPPVLISSSTPVFSEKVTEPIRLDESSALQETSGTIRQMNSVPSDVTNPTNENSSKVNNDENSTDVTIEVVTCEARFVPLLIGKRGWTIKHIQDDSGARVDIDQRVTPRQVRISGNKANVDKAVTMVRDVLSYPHAQLQSTSQCIEGDGSDILPQFVSADINQSEAHVMSSTPTKQELLAASAFLEHDVTRSAIQNETGNRRIQSPPPPLVGDAKSAISASSSLSSTPEPSMASSSKGFIAPHLQNGPSLPPSTEQFAMATNPSHQSPGLFPHPDDGIPKVMGATGLWPSSGLIGGPRGTLAPHALYVENISAPHAGGQIGIGHGPASRPQMHESFRQQSNHLQMNNAMMLQQQQLSRPFYPEGQASRGITSPTNMNRNPMLDHSSPFSSQNIGNNQSNQRGHLGGGSSYNLYNNDMGQAARPPLSTTPLRDLMQRSNGPSGTSQMMNSGYVEGGNGLWKSGNQDFSSGLPPQPTTLQPRASSGFSTSSMGFSSGHNSGGPHGYSNSQVTASQPGHPKITPGSGTTQGPFAGSIPSGLRNDDSLVIDSLFGHPNGVQTNNTTATKSLLTGFNGLSLPSQSDGMKSSGLWGNANLEEVWHNESAQTMNGPSSGPQKVSSIDNIFSNDVPNLSQDRPRHSRFNWDSTTPQS